MGLVCENGNCERASEAVKVYSGWLFANLFSYYFRHNKLIFNDGSDKNIGFSVTKAWLDNNRISKRFAPEGYDNPFYFLTHVEQCSDERCQEAYERYKQIKPLIETSNLLGENIKSNNSNKLVRLSIELKQTQDEKRTQDEEQDLYDEIILKGDEWDYCIEKLRPFFKWFQEKNLWIE